MNKNWTTIAKDWLKSKPKLYTATLFIFTKESKVRFILRRIVRFPQRHANFLRKHSTLCGYGVYPRNKTINLSHPMLFDDKLLWLKYYKYNKSKLVAKCYDKYLVREYVESCGCGYILNELYGVWDSIDDIEWDRLPEEYVLKKSNSYGDHVFKYIGEKFDVREAAQKLAENENARKKVFRATGDLFATVNKQLYICEKMLHSEEGYERPEDYKFYCFNGQPKYLLYMWDRRGSSTYKATFKDIDLHNKCSLFLGTVDMKIRKPECYEEMLDVCRRLAKPFPFVRVDLYVQNDRLVFGELTFTPAGSQVLYHVFKNDGSINYEALNEMGDALDITYIQK